MLCFYDQCGPSCKQGNQSNFINFAFVLIIIISMDLINIRTSKNICIDINLIAFNSLFF